MPQASNVQGSAPPLFRQGASALSQWLLCSALALFLMVADARFHVTEPLRQGVAALLYPLQWLVQHPSRWIHEALAHTQSLQEAQQQLQEAQQKMTAVTVAAGEGAYLQRENDELRQLLELRARLQTPGRAAQVLYDSADPYTRRVVIDGGQLAGVQPGSPVVDAAGVLGQVTRVYPLLSEVTLLIDRDQAIPVLNVRTGARSVAYGEPTASYGGGMELRFTPGNADVEPGDLLTTSGVDGLYPPGLPVARVVHVERRADSTFARIYCTPVAQVYGARHVMVLSPPDTAALPPRPPAPEAPLLRSRGRP